MVRYPDFETHEQKRFNRNIQFINHYHALRIHELYSIMPDRHVYIHVEAIQVIHVTLALVIPASIFELKELLKILESRGPRRPTRTSEHIRLI